MFLVVASSSQRVTHQTHSLLMHRDGYSEKTAACVAMSGYASQDSTNLHMVHVIVKNKRVKFHDHTNQLIKFYLCFFNIFLKTVNATRKML